MSSNADRGQKIVENILKSPGNNNCVDCGALGEFELYCLYFFTLVDFLLYLVLSFTCFSFYVSLHFTFTRFAFSLFAPFSDLL